ncbi:hypothetical protein BKA67DRAFT_656248 [Truncatella angustata]|uniref:Uncharacterized protein n=1 Tax=Truncatella angustata TaxID=152316 RepID=A0A9P8UTG6_9PEZI|nr:uncharacterized protein BKA67DRAFT_656248 [Truncatella angustata]KAH6658016.1 hypothetical protein BKA67DRAFT_656248 [Truncatella angustata]
MKLLTYVLLAVSASAAFVDPQGRRVVDRKVEQQVEAPKARDLAFDIRHSNERKKANGTAQAAEAQQASNTTSRFIAVRKSSNATARALRRATRASKNNTARGVREDGRAYFG